MKKLIKKFIKETPIETGGAITIPKVSCTYYDDGDTGYYIKIPYCSCNMVWQKSAFDFVEKFQKEFGHCNIILNTKYFKIDFNLTQCDSD